MSSKILNVQGFKTKKHQSTEAMSSKWNERLVTGFLKQYRRHPCLWNPFHQDYYNCREKNAALRRIIGDLGTPGFTVTDYLHQIRIIREKYKKEQARIIKGLQCQKNYKSPFPWYNIVAEMLTKVINDEERANSVTALDDGESEKPTLRSLSSDNVRDPRGKEAKPLRVRPCTDATCEELARRSKSLEKSARSKRTTTSRNAGEARLKVKYVPCPQARRTEEAARDEEEDVLFSCKPTRDTDSGAKGCTVPYTLIHPTSNDLAGGVHRNGAGFLQCPLCGWEEAKGVAGNKETPEWRNSIPCSNYNRNPSHAGYSICTGCDGGLRDSGDYAILGDLTKHVPCSSLESRYGKVSAESRCEAYTSPAVPLKKDKDVGVQCEAEAKEEVPVQTQTIRLDPDVAKKFQGGTIEACTRLKIVLLDSKGNVAAEDNASCDTQGVQCNRSGSLKETQQDILKTTRNEACVNTTNHVEAGVNTMNNVEAELQDTVCVSAGMRRCVSLQTLNQTDESGKEGPPSCCVRDLIPSMESKEVGVNIVDQVSKGTQSVVCVSRGNMVQSSCFEKMKDTGTTPSVQDVRDNICVSPENLRTDKANCATATDDGQCVSLIPAKSQGHIKHCVVQADLKETTERGTHYEIPCRTDTCPRNLLQIIKEDPAVAQMVQQLLTKIVSRRSEHGTQSTKASKTCNVQTDQEHKCDATGNCALDVAEMVNKIKEHAIKTLELSPESVPKEKEFSKATDISTTRGGIKCTCTQASAEAESYDLTVCQSTVPDEDKTRASKDKTLCLEAPKKPLFVDKGVFASREKRDTGTDGSQLPVCDMGTQSGSKSLSDAVCSAECEKRRITVGTQKRDPILVRVIKCNEGQSTVKLDKETLTEGTSGVHKTKHFDKRTETCGKSTCVAYTVCGQPRKENLDCALQKDQEDRIEAFKNLACDKTCKGKACCGRDWTDVTNIDPFCGLYNSKIPLCLKSRRCTYTRNN